MDPGLLCSKESTRSKPYLAMLMRHPYYLRTLTGLLCSRLGTSSSWLVFDAECQKRPSSNKRSKSFIFVVLKLDVGQDAASEFVALFAFLHPDPNLPCQNNSTKR